MAKTSASRARSRVLASEDASIKKYVLKIEIIVCNTPVRKKAAFASKTEIVFCKQGCPNPNKAVYRITINRRGCPINSLHNVIPNSIRNLYTICNVDAEIGCKQPRSA